jgi:exosortase F-associated protein
MLKILLSHKVRVTIGFVLVVLLLVVRAFEDELFYDPFELFQSDFNVCHYRLMIRFTY